jgi:hypothetical protein
VHTDLIKKTNLVELCGNRCKINKRWLNYSLFFTSQKETPGSNVHVDPDLQMQRARQTRFSLVLKYSKLLSTNAQSKKRASGFVVNL